jgi:tetratricopeptide (TPR) repeat protein
LKKKTRDQAGTPPAAGTTHLQADFERALSLHQQGQWTAALPLYERVLQQAPAHFDALHLAGLLLHQTGRSAQGAEWMRRAVALRPTNAVAHSNLGLALMALHDPAAALAEFDAAVAYQGGYAKAHRNRGDALQQLGQFSAAVDSYDRALALQPEDAPTWVNRGQALLRTGRLDDALASQAQAVALEPGNAQQTRQMGVMLREQGQHERALACLERAQQLHDDPKERYALGQYHLFLGHLERGWSLLSARWLLPEHAQELARFAQAPWPAQGAPTPDDGRLLVWGEQGLGDQILLLGMLPSLLARGADVAVAVEARLVPLVARSFPQVRAVPLNDPVLDRPARYQSPLSGLGPVFRRCRDDFADTRSPYLQADPQRVQALRAQLGGGAQPVVGLSWSSHNPRLMAQKSLPLLQWGPVLQQPGHRFVDLQYGDTTAERTAVKDTLGVDVAHLDEVDNTADIDALAALVCACDVVVTVSNTTAHLAAALGRPVLLMLPRARGLLWYWQDAGARNPWYPSVHIFRQTVAGEWGDVLQQVAHALPAAAGATPAA